jgi:hypothetical protein
MATHIVKKNETLSTIGAQYGVNWQTIASTNGIAPPYTVYVGQSIVIPNGASVTTNSGGGGLQDTNVILDKIIGGVLLYGIFKVLMKVF